MLSTDSSFRLSGMGFFHTIEIAANRTIRSGVHRYIVPRWEDRIIDRAAGLTKYDVTHNKPSP
jgi:hypothetical protein